MIATYRPPLTTSGGLSIGSGSVHVTPDAFHRMPSYFQRPALGRLTLHVLFPVLCEVSQRTNRKPRAVAQALLDWALGRPLPYVVGRELDATAQRAQDPTQRQALTSPRQAGQPHL
ncbi:hypothetical protein [Streptomyces sp. NPDC029041]|uniref:hypothetical protein n=1 Tax=Streptomyces sp. NPDC029041 TaxID=3155727 RepID=UPI0033E5E9E4